VSAHGASSNGQAHEKTDASTRPVFRFAAGLAVFVAAAMALMAMLFTYFTAREAALDVPLSPLAKEAPAPVSGPLLQPNPPADLEQLRHDENAQLTSYGWVDERERLVHIPIDRAIGLMAERGLPSRGTTPAAK
jgi:hypothetical protein